MNALVLVETRSVPVDDSINRHLQYLPGWKPVVVCSNENRRMITHDKVIVNKITPERYYHDYNVLFASVAFWDNFLKYERVMICHQDSGLLRLGVDDFLEWDYVGAPWKFQDHGGNGGLSLRNPQIMREICAKFRYSPHEYEDVFFCNRMNEHKIGLLAPREVCKKFSCETIFELGTLGYHNIESYFPERVDEILNQYAK